MALFCTDTFADAYAAEIAAAAPELELIVLRPGEEVSADDIETLVPRVFSHRVDLAPGITDLQSGLEEAMERSIEGLARTTMRRP